MWSLRLRCAAAYLVTDGNLPRAEQVLARIHELNADGKVRVHTFVLGDDREEDPRCVEALRRIAAGNAGTFTHLAAKELERRK